MRAFAMLLGDSLMDTLRAAVSMAPLTTLQAAERVLAMLPECAKPAVASGEAAG